MEAASFDIGEMEFDRGKLASEKCKGKGLNFVKTTSVSGAELCLDNDIPEWLLMEVLIRLPVKLVFKCKLVCKRWLSVISDTSFVRMYVLRASLSTQLPTWTFIYPDMYVEGEPEYEVFEDIYSQDLKCPSLYVFRCPFITYPSMKKYKIVGVSNDLVLYGPHEKVGPHCIYNICNPITRQWISLPPCTHCPNDESIGFVTRIENGVLSSHKVVRFEVPFGLFQITKVIRFLVFISETSEWKEFDVNAKQEKLDITLRDPTTLNGILHWVTNRHGIMAYDPYQNTYSVRFIPLPSDIDTTCNYENAGIRSLCYAYQGRLRYLESPANPSHGFSSIGVWILNDYISGDWCLDTGSTLLTSYTMMSFLAYIFFYYRYHPFDPEIVYLAYDETIVSYNMETRKLEYHGGVFSRRDHRYWLWTFLFVIPPWPTAIGPPSSSGVLV